MKIPFSSLVNAIKKTSVSAKKAWDKLPASTQKRIEQEVVNFIKDKITVHATKGKG